MKPDDLEQHPSSPAPGRDAEGSPVFSAFSGPVEELVAGGVLEAPSQPGLLGRIDHLEVIRQIGQGGMGIVFLARDRRTGEEVAVKLLRPEYARDAGLTRRFLKEAENLRQLDHPHLLRVRGVCDRDAGPYFVMPFYSRGSLGFLLKNGQPLPRDGALGIALQLADALRFIHRKWMFHRDVKPGNILIDGEGKVRLADFGLARPLFNESPAGGMPTCPEGTAPYMSPLVAAGEAEDTRCDIYAFGAVLYEMLTGRPPYQGKDSREILEKIKAGPPQPIREVNVQADPGLTAVAEKAMARAHSDRFANMDDVVAALERVGKGEDPLVALPPGSERRRPSRFRRGILPGSALGLLIAGIMMLAYYSHPKLKLLRKIPVPGVASHLRYASPGDWDGDGRPDLLFVKDGALHVLLNTGVWVQPVELRVEHNTPAHVRMALDVNNDALDEAFINWANVTNESPVTEAHLGAFDRYGFIVKHFRVPGSVAFDKDWGAEPSVLRPARLVDLDGDKQPELLAVIDTGYAKRPRGLCCFNVATEKLEWFFETASCVNSVECADLDGDGKPEILVGSTSTRNGNVVTNGTDVTDDSHSYFYLLSGDGRCLWRKTMGEVYSAAEPVALHTAVTNEVLVWASTTAAFDGSPSQPAVGNVLAFDPRGNLLHTYSAGVQLWSAMAVGREGNGTREVVATDKLGRLHVLNSNLELRQAPVEVVPNRGSFVGLFLLGEVPIDGGRRRAMALSAYQVSRDVTGPLEGRIRENSPKHVLDGFQLTLLDSSFEPIARHLLAERVTDGVGPVPNFFLVPNTKPPQFVVYGNEVEFLEFSRW